MNSATKSWLINDNGCEMKEEYMLYQPTQVNKDRKMMTLFLGVYPILASGQKCFRGDQALEMVMPVIIKKISL